MNIENLSFLSNQNKKNIWLARLSSFSGDYLYQIAFIWIAWETSKSAAFTGSVAAAHRIPFWCFGIYAGIIADRFDRKSIANICTFLRSIFSFILFTLYFLDLITPLLLIVLVFLNAVAWSWENPAVSALLPQLTQQSKVGEINHLIDNTKRIASVAMPLLSIFFATRIEVSYYFVFTAILYLATSAFIYKLTPIVLFEPVVTKFALINNLKDAFRIFFQYKPIVIIVLCFSFYNLSYGAGMVLVPILVETNYKLGLGVFSTFLAAQGAGGLITNIILRKKTSTGISVLPFYGFLIFTSCLLIISLFDNKAILIVFGFLGGCGLPLMDIYVPNLIHKIGKPQHHGRLFAIWRFFADFGIAIGLLISGFVAELWKVSATLTTISVLVIPITIYALYRFNRSVTFYQMNS